MAIQARMAWVTYSYSIRAIKIALEPLKPRKCSADILTFFLIRWKRNMLLQRYLVIVKSVQLFKKRKSPFCLSLCPRVFIESANTVCYFAGFPNITGIIILIFGSLSITWFCESLRYDSILAVDGFPKQGEKASLCSYSLIFKSGCSVEDMI